MLKYKSARSVVKVRVQTLLMIRVLKVDGKPTIWWWSVLWKKWLVISTLLCSVATKLCVRICCVACLFGNCQQTCIDPWREGPKPTFSFSGAAPWWVTLSIWGFTLTVMYMVSFIVYVLVILNKWNFLKIIPWKLSYTNSLFFMSQSLILWLEITWWERSSS